MSAGAMCAEPILTPTPRSAPRQVRAVPGGQHRDCMSPAATADPTATIPTVASATWPSWWWSCRRPGRPTARSAPAAAAPWTADSLQSMGSSSSGRRRRPVQLGAGRSASAPMASVQLVHERRAGGAIAPQRVVVLALPGAARDWPGLVVGLDQEGRGISHPARQEIPAAGADELSGAAGRPPRRPRRPRRPRWRTGRPTTSTTVPIDPTDPVSDPVPSPTNPCRPAPPGTTDLPSLAAPLTGPTTAARSAPAGSMQSPAAEGAPATTRSTPFPRRRWRRRAIVHLGPPAPISVDGSPWSGSAQPGAELAQSPGAGPRPIGGQDTLEVVQPGGDRGGAGLAGRGPPGAGGGQAAGRRP